MKEEHAQRITWLTRKNMELSTEKEALQKCIDELEVVNETLRARSQRIIELNLGPLNDRIKELEAQLKNAEESGISVSKLYAAKCDKVRELEAQLKGKVVAEFDGKAQHVETKFDEEKIGVWSDGIGAYSTHEAGWPCLYRFKKGNHYIIRIIEKDKS